MLFSGKKGKIAQLSAEIVTMAEDADALGLGAPESEAVPRLACEHVDARARRDAADQVYLAILSRFPTDPERAVLASHARRQGRSAWFDLTWALINSAEFLYRH